MYITDYHKSFVLCYALHYYPFVEDHQVSIMAYQVFDHNGLVGQVGVEPTAYLTCRIYSPVQSPLCILTHIWLRMLGSNQH